MHNGSLNSTTALRPAPPQPCWLEVDLDRVRHNVRQLRELIGPQTQLTAVVKADAYGLGASDVARAALDAGAAWLAVARIEEGVRLRQAGIQAPILNLAYTAPAEAQRLVDYQLTPTIADLQTARAIAAAAPFGSIIDIHLKVDTGLSRYGAQPDELLPLLQGLAELPRLRIHGLATHFASADEADLGFAEWQLRRFMEVEQVVRRYTSGPLLRHAANSAATLALPAAHLDLVRVGITLSGHYPSADVPRSAGIEPAIALRARVARVYDLPAGASIGYNRTHRTPGPTRVALVPVGYADGLPRSHSNHAQVLIRGRRAPLIGRVSMDQSVADVTTIPGVMPGDEITLIGRQGDAQIDLDEFAAWGGTIGHEALCRIGARVPRYYRQISDPDTTAWLAHPSASNGHDARSRLLAHSSGAHL